MNAFSLPVSARRAADVLIRCGGGFAAENSWSEDEREPAAGEMERRELVFGIAERVAALRASAVSDPAEMDVCLRLLNHLSEPAGRAATICRTLRLQ
jgi:hypothetical protein